MVPTTVKMEREMPAFGSRWNSQMQIEQRHARSMQRVRTFARPVEGTNVKALQTKSHVAAAQGFRWRPARRLEGQRQARSVSHSIQARRPRMIAVAQARTLATPKSSAGSTATRGRSRSRSRSSMRFGRGKPFFRQSSPMYRPWSSGPSRNSSPSSRSCSSGGIAIAT